MSTAQQAVTRDGRPWNPTFLEAINQATCIGCGRCYKVCSRSVMDLKGINEDGEIVGLDDDDEIERKVMTVVDPGSCIGCGACGKVCSKNCQTYAAV